MVDSDRYFNVSFVLLPLKQRKPTSHQLPASPCTRGKRRDDAAPDRSVFFMFCILNYVPTDAFTLSSPAPQNIRFLFFCCSYSFLFCIQYYCYNYYLHYCSHVFSVFTHEYIVQNVRCIVVLFSIFVRPTRRSLANRLFQTVPHHDFLTQLDTV